MYNVPMIFPGQASQVVGMARDLTEQARPAADLLAKVDAILDCPLTSIMFEGPIEVLTETRNAQPAILAHSVAVAAALREKGVVPSVVAGHSLGEYSAAVAAGVLSAADALQLVRRRGELMFAAGQKQPGTMAAVLGLAADRVDEVCSAVAKEHGVVCLANHNSASQVAISGEVRAVETAADALKEAGAKRVVMLNVSGAFHSPLLADAATEFSTYLAGFTVRDAAVPLVANVSAAPVREAAEIRVGLDRQLTSPVLWQDTMDRIATGRDESPRLILEVGPGRVLTNLARRAYPDVEFVPVGTQEQLNAIPDLLAEKLK